MIGAGSTISVIIPYLRLTDSNNQLDYDIVLIQRVTFRPCVCFVCAHSCILLFADACTQLSIDRLEVNGPNRLPTVKMALVTVCCGGIPTCLHRLSMGA